MAKLIEQNIQETAQCLTFTDAFTLHTVQRHLAAVLFVAIIAASYTLKLLMDFYQLILNFSVLELGQFIIETFLGLMLPTLFCAIFLYFGRGQNKRLVFDKQNDQFRFESQFFLYQFPVGNPRCLKNTALSSITTVEVGSQEVNRPPVQSSYVNSPGGWRTIKTLDIYIHAQSKPFASVSLSRCADVDALTLEAIADRISSFLNLN